MAEKNLEVEGLEELLRALEETPERAKPILKKKMGASLELIEGEVKPYPPQPSRTRAKTFNTYVRGRGQYPKSAFGGKTFNPKKARGLVKAGKVRLTSERLGTKWTSDVEISDEVVVGVIGNTASYADEVQGERQPAFHAATGWITLDQGMEQAEQGIYAQFKEGAEELAHWIETE